MPVSLVANNDIWLKRAADGGASASIEIGDLNARSSRLLAPMEYRKMVYFMRTYGSVRVAGICTGRYESNWRIVLIG